MTKAARRFDYSIPISVGLLATHFVVDRAIETSDLFDPDAPAIAGVWFLAGFIAAIRLLVLWFQTLRAALSHPDLNHRFVWTILHFAFGPLTAVVYYVASRIELASGEEDRASR